MKERTNKLANCSTKLVQKGEVGSSKGLLGHLRKFEYVWYN